MVTLDEVGGVDHLAKQRRVPEQGGELVPVLAPRADNHGILGPQVCSKVSNAAHAPSSVDADGKVPWPWFLTLHQIVLKRRKTRNPDWRAGLMEDNNVKETTIRLQYGQVLGLGNPSVAGERSLRT